MPKDIHVIVVEDDLYARDLMSLLLNRDWRTRVVAEVGNQEALESALVDAHTRVDAVLLDTEVPNDPEWAFRLADVVRSIPNPPAVLCIATKPDTETLSRLLEGSYSGYALKKEVGYALAAAVTHASKYKNWVMTKSVYQLALRQRLPIPENAILLDGNKPAAPFTPREEEIARLAVLFNLAHRDLSDELLIRADQVSKYVSSVYDKLGLDQILSGDIEAETIFQDKVLLRHFKNILDRVAKSKSRRKTADMATLAFHLLTMPEIREDIF
jgi:DNA-binding NarL/FixJ family response regulator